ncbi:MAG: HPP family protein [Gallionellaceae bacterium]|nr:MAG: HPP family protein [Gallionellaceae bacterium]
MMNFLNKLCGERTALPPRASGTTIGLGLLGGILAMGLLAGLLEASGIPWVLGSFGASCVLVFGYPDSPFSQPRNIVLGHALSSFIGLLFLAWCGAHWWSVALATGIAIGAMMWTRTVHPPAGSNPVIIYLTQPAWSFLLTPTLAGALVLTLLALLYHNISRKAAWPKYW